MASKKRTATSLQSQSHVCAVTAVGGETGDDLVDYETVNVENNDSGSGSDER
jgi:hypothetical protein